MSTCESCEYSSHREFEEREWPAPTITVDVGPFWNRTTEERAIGKPLIFKASWEHKCCAGTTIIARGSTDPGQYPCGCRHHSGKAK